MLEGLQNRMAMEMCAGPTSEKACNHGLEPCGPEGRQLGSCKLQQML